jgi:SAM-dependent methyltransferase
MLDGATSTADAARRPVTACIVCGGEQRGSFRKSGWWYCRCRRCGLVSQVPVPDEATILEHYHRGFAAGNYRLLLDSAERYRPIYEDYAERLARLVDFAARPKVLDVGCFTGEMLCVLRDAGADVYGLELQEEAARIAAERLPGRVFQARVEGAEFPQVDYDAVTLLAVIEHVVDPVALVRRCSELLRPGGVLMVQTPNSGSGLAKVTGKHWPLYAPVEHLHLFAADSLRRLLAALGMEEIRIGRHTKRLPVEYVFEMMRSYGPEWRRLVAPVYRALPASARRARLPFSGGEMIATARKPS